MMASETFENKIRSMVKTLTSQQQVEFAWRCAVRVLPYIGGKGKFVFWHKKDRQRHLYAIFNALDSSIFYGLVGIKPSAITAIDAYNAAADAHAADAYAAYAAYAAADANDAANAAANAAAYVDAAHVDAANVIKQFNNISEQELTAYLLQELTTIQGKKTTAITLEGHDLIWQQFQQALKREGCGYWGKLYQGIFERGFKVDVDALTRRLNVPKEIKEQGATAVANYLQRLETGAQRLNESRIIILGEKGAGKTCIARRLVDPDALMTKSDESTAGVDTTTWILDDDNMKVRIWDFAGHTVTHAVHKFFLSERCLYILVYDGRSEQRNRLNYWLDHMKNHGGDSKAIILVNEHDSHKVDIPINALKEKYAIDGVYFFSIKDDTQKLVEFRDEIANIIRHNPCWNQLEIPTDYYQVKADLERLFDQQEQGKEHISKAEFAAIAKSHHVDDVDQLLKDLNALGISLWYEELADFNTLVLNPEWISHGVYKIINWVANHPQKHSIALTDFTAVFAGDDAERFGTEHHPFLFSLMKHYELAYQTDDGQSLVIPHLLQQDRPEQLPDFAIGESLMLKYQAELPLPPHTISRFIVRHHQQIQKAGNATLVWRLGAVLGCDQQTLALVREDDRSITISVKGANKTEFLSQLRDTLDDIFASYKSDKPALLYRVERHGLIDDKVEQNNPLWLTDSKIINHVNAKHPYFEDITQRDMDLEPTRAQYNIINAHNLVIGGQGHKFTEDNSTRFNFEQCNVGMQEQLNELAQYLTESGNKTEAQELENTAKALEQAEDCDDPQAVKKKGVGRRMQRLLEDMGDKNSSLHKAVEGTKYGVGIAQDIAKGYNDIAQWAGMPQVPKVFLKNQKKD